MKHVLTVINIFSALTNYFTNQNFLSKLFIISALTVWPQLSKSADIYRFLVENCATSTLNKREDLGKAVCYQLIQRRKGTQC